MISVFHNIGKKMKGLAELVAVFGIILSVFFGLVVMGEISTWIGLGITVAGSLLSWISSFLLYGFGELVDKTSEIAHQLKPDGAERVDTAD